jgi:hypothetical protein
MPWCREKNFDLRLEFHLGLPFLTVCLGRCATSGHRRIRTHHTPSIRRNLNNENLDN